MKSFNNKHQAINALAIPFSLIGFLMLILAWCYHVAFQWVFLPRDKWVNVFSLQAWNPHKHYPNWFCYWMCTVEENMIEHLRLMRNALDNDYCDSNGE